MAALGFSLVRRQLAAGAELAAGLVLEARVAIEPDGRRRRRRRRLACQQCSGHELASCDSTQLGSARLGSAQLDWRQPTRTGETSKLLLVAVVVVGSGHALMSTSGRLSPCPCLLLRSSSALLFSSSLPLIACPAALSQWPAEQRSKAAAGLRQAQPPALAVRAVLVGARCRLAANDNWRRPRTFRAVPPE